MLACIARLCGSTLSFVAVFSLCLTPVLGQGARPPQGAGDARAASETSDHPGQGRPSEAVLQQSFVLDAANRRATLLGLEVLLPADYLGSLPVVVHAKCLSGSETPALAVDATIYGANARLLNRTSSHHGGCDSYRVAAATLQGPLVSPAGVSPRGSEAKGIAVGVREEPV
jgi:hypothetical protein